MNKFTFLLLACIMAVVSCKDNGEDPNDPDNGEDGNPDVETTLPKTIEMSFEGDTRTYNITYQGDTKKIDKISRSGLVETYVYDENNRIQKIYRGSANDGDYNLYTYDGSGRLIKEEGYRPDESPTVSEIDYSGTKPVVSLRGEGEVELTHDSKGNLTNAALIFGGTSAGAVSLTYDDKNAPFKNVVGWSEVYYLVGAPLGDNIWLEDIAGAGNNPLKLTGSFMGQIANITYVYEFKDSKNPKFPTRVTGTKKVGSDPAVTFEAKITYK